MSTAVQIVLDEDLLTEFSEAELVAAAVETSAIYDGLVLAAALKIVLHRLGVNRRNIAALLHRPTTTVYRWAEGRPCKAHWRCERAIVELGQLLWDAITSGTNYGKS